MNASSGPRVPERTEADGPSQRLAAAPNLVARVVDWEDGGAIHGYAVVDDLARNYAPHETLLLSLTGTPPTHEQGRAFGVALTWISAPDIGSAPTHAAVLAQISGAPVTNLLAIAALAAGSEIEHILNSPHPPVDRGPGGEVPAISWRRELRTACEVDIPELDHVQDASTAALTVFRSVGLEGRTQTVSAWIWGRLIGVLAEALATTHLDMRNYPLRVPPFEYQEHSS